MATHRLAGALAGCHAMVTGAGSGIGAAIAWALAAEGAAVSLLGRRPGLLAEVASSLPRATAIAADVTSADDCRRAIATANAAFGPVDIVVANAGAAHSAAFAKLGADQWRQMLDVNLTGAFNTVQAALTDVTRPPDAATPGENSRPRRILFVASTAGLKGYPYVAAYVAAKHGVIGLMRALAVEFAATPLTVNAICPGFTDTPLLDGAVAAITSQTGRSADDARRALTRANPQGRFIRPEEVAATVLWLCSDGAASVTGQAISVSGGEI